MPKSVVVAMVDSDIVVESMVVAVAVVSASVSASASMSMSESSGSLEILFSSSLSFLSSSPSFSSETCNGADSGGIIGGGGGDADEDVVVSNNIKLGAQHEAAILRYALDECSCCAEVGT